MAHPPSKGCKPTDHDNNSGGRSNRQEQAAGECTSGSGIPRAGVRDYNNNTDQSEEYDFPDSYTALDELAEHGPDQNPDDDAEYRHDTLEQERREEQRCSGNTRSDQQLSSRTSRSHKPNHDGVPRPSRLATQLYTISYLILFAIFGTLARLGLQGIMFYPGAPVVFGVLWANFAGSLIFGFLSEDRMLFKEEWGTPKYSQAIEQARRAGGDEEGSLDEIVDLAKAKKDHNATKKTIPLYIGLATGFCGSFTSFSSFVRDAFLALSNDLPTPLNHPEDYAPVAATTNSTYPRNGGYSFTAFLAVVIITISLCMSALHLGAHLAVATEQYIPSWPYRFARRVLDPLCVFLAFGSWLGAVLLAIFPPDRNSGGSEVWRGRAVFAIVFAPLGCLARFYTSLWLNPKLPSFPLGTFVVNVAGTIVLGMCWDFQHVPLGGIVGCQVLQGVEDGFCGCLTTVSTWVGELGGLRKSHAYKYGTASVVVAICFLIVIMGSLRWTEGFSSLQCIK